VQRFVAAGRPAEQIPQGEQASLPIKLLAVYEQAGLAHDPWPQPLCRCCRHNERCWTGPQSEHRHPTATEPEDGAVMLPWVGPKYRPGGVAIIAINPNIAPDDPTNLLLEHGISWDQHEAKLRQNFKLNDRSPFAWKSLTTAAALLDYIDGRPAQTREPRELIDALHRTARLQAVKCVPKVRNSTPRPGMQKLCPAFLLGDELRVLEPGYVLVFGVPAREAVRRLSEFVPEKSSPHLSSGRLISGDWSADTFALAHPSAHYDAWNHSHAALLDLLGDRRE
jgi:hypothetical protein